MGTLSVGMLLLGWSGPRSMHSRLKVTQQRRDPSPGRHRPESGVAMHRIRRSASTGNGGRDQTETVVAMHRITQPSPTAPASGSAQAEFLHPFAEAKFSLFPRR